MGSLAEVDLVNENSKLKLMVTSMKNWLNSLPDCLKTPIQSTEKEMLIDSLNCWLRNIPLEWSDNRNEETVQKIKYESSPYEVIEEMQTDTTDDVAGFTPAVTHCSLKAEDQKDLNVEESAETITGHRDENFEEIKPIEEEDVKVEFDLGPQGEITVPIMDDSGSNHGEEDCLGEAQNKKDLKTCILCGEIFASGRDYHQHKKIVHGFRNHHYPCNKCQYTASSLTLIVKHMKNHNIGDPTDLSNGPEQEESSTAAKIYKCQACDYESFDCANFLKHKKTVHGFRRGHYPCPICPYVAIHCANSLRVHIDAVHKKIKHPCDECEKVFGNNSALRKHKRTYHLRITYDCQHCDYKGNGAWQLKCHVDDKHKGIRHYCDQCTFSATSANGLSYHIKRVHDLHVPARKKDENAPKLHCDMCVYSCVKKTNLEIHIATKHEGKAYNCDLCPYTSKHPTSLRLHVKSKHENIIHKCDQCDMIFTLKGNLQRHRIMVAKKKDPSHRNTCKLCGFVSCLSLEKHMTKDHPDIEKLHQCDECDKAFNSLSYLKKHKKIKHRLERIECDECDKSFVSNENLKMHKKSFHKDKKYLLT